MKIMPTLKKQFISLSAVFNGQSAVISTFTYEDDPKVYLEQNRPAFNFRNIILRNIILSSSILFERYNVGKRFNMTKWR